MAAADNTVTSEVHHFSKEEALQSRKGGELSNSLAGLVHHPITSFTSSSTTTTTTFWYCWFRAYLMTSVKEYPVGV